MITVATGGAVAELRASAEAEWTAATHHRFVSELFAGTVDDAVMAKYLVQDYQFFDDFLSMLGASVAHADTIAAKLRFAQQLGFLAADEDSYFLRAFAEVGVEPADYTDPQLTEVTAGFRDVMREAVAAASYSDVLVVLVIAEWLYLEWGEQDRAMPSRDLHTGWIDLHRGEAFTAWVQFLVDELERVYPRGDDAASAAARQRLADLWQRAVGLERAFFDEAYR